MILLTDEELDAIDEDGSNYTAKDVFRAIAKAQLKKVVGILKERELALENDNRIFVIGDKLWQALKKQEQVSNGQ